MSNGFKIALSFSMLFIGCGELGGDAPPSPDTGKASSRRTVSKTPRREAPPAPRPKGPARIGDVGLLPVKTATFVDALDTSSKRLVFQYYLAALEADDAHFSRYGADVLRVKTILDGISQYSKGVDGTLLDKITPYARRFYLNYGPIDQWSGRRIRPTFIPGELAAATQMAMKAGANLGVEEFEGADLGANRLEQLEAFLGSVRPVIFGQVTPRLPTAKTGEGQGAPPEAPGSHPDLQEPVWLCNLNGPLRAALPLLKDPEEKRLVESLLSSSEEADQPELSAYFKRWLAGRAKVSLALAAGQEPTVLVGIRDDEQSAILSRVGDEVAYFERNLPGNAGFRRLRKDIVKSNIGVYNLIVATGAAGHASRIWHTVLPFRLGLEGLPQRSMIFSNLLDAAEGVYGDRVISAFSYDDETRYRRTKWRSAGTRAFLALKHVLGYSAGVKKTNAPVGQMPKPLNAGDEAPLRLLDELRSDLVALYYSGDSRVIELGLVPEEECGVAILDEYTSGLIERSVSHGLMPNLPEETVIAQRIVIRYAIEKGAAEVSQKDGHVYARVVDAAALKGAVSSLLGEVIRISAAGDTASLKALEEQYGRPIREVWKKDAMERFEALDLPAKLAFVYPALKPELGVKGEVKDVQVLLPKDPLDALTGRTGRKPQR